MSLAVVKSEMSKMNYSNLLSLVHKPFVNCIRGSDKMVNGSPTGKVFVFLTGIVYGTLYWYRSSFGPIIDVLQSEFHATSSEIGLMTALFWFGYVILQIPCGVLLQYLTAKFIIIISSLLFAITTLLFSLPLDARSIIWLGFVMILTGVVAPPVWLASLKSPNN